MGDRPPDTAMIADHRIVVRCLVLVLLAACHVGAGPVVAFSPQHGLRIGGEASAGAAFLGSTWGATYAPWRESSLLSYLTVDPGWATDLNIQNRDAYLGFGGTLGKAFGSGIGNGADDGLAVGLWAAPFITFDNCSDNSGIHPTYSAAVGYRYLGGVGELFVAPKVNAVALPGPCD
jgi:hypothetical protein